MRKLASIQKIVKLEPIEGADFIEKATVLGWECVVKKGDFKEGSPCVFFEIDAIVPDHPHFEFMRDRKFRVRTIKLKRQVSQGLALPISILSDFGINPDKVKEDQDVTKKIGVVKHDPQALKEANAQKRREDQRWFITKYLMQFKLFRDLYYKFGRKHVLNFPWFIPKTDETRIQNIPQVIDQYAGKVFYSSEKLDGTSFTSALHKEKIFGPFSREVFYVCSRNLTKYKEDKSEWWQIAKKYDIKERLKKYNGRYAVQGEIIGPGVQGNKYKLKELELKVFNVYDLKKNRYLSLEEKLQFCKEAGFESVPIMEENLVWDKGTTVQYFIDSATGKSTVNKDIYREGKVFRAYHDDSISFKAISPKFLLKYNE